MKKIIKKLFHLIGFDVARVRKSKDESEDQVSNSTNEFEWLKEYNFKTIIDVGANEGQFSAKISSVFPEAHIHCFEPLPDAFKQLQSNFKDKKNFTLNNFGLGAQNEEKSIFKNEYTPSSSLLEMLDLHKKNFDFAVNVEPEKILIKRLDDVFTTSLEQPLLLKIDVQGYETFVIKGGETVISQAEMIIVETSFYPLYKDQPLFEDIYDYFIGAGFRYAGNVEQLLSAKDQKILQADAVFIKKRDNTKSSY